MLFPTTLVGSYPQPDWLIDRKRLTENIPPRVSGDPALMAPNQPPYPAVGYMVGRGLRDPTRTYNAQTNAYEGPAQDLVVLPPIKVPLP